MKKAFILVFLFFIALLFCKKNIPPEPKIIVSEEKKERNVYYSSAEARLSEFINNFIEDLKSKIYERNISHINRYFILMDNNRFADQLIYFNSYIKSAIEDVASLVDNHQIKNILKNNKDVIIFELTSAYMNNQYTISLSAYYPLMKRYLFSINKSIQSHYEIDDYLKKNFPEKLPMKGNIMEDFLLASVNEEIVDIKIIDLNNDNKNDVVIFGIDNIYIWIMAYNYIIDNIRIEIPMELRVKSKNPAGIIFNYDNHYLYFLATFLVKGICLDAERDFSLGDCPEKLIQDTTVYKSFVGKNYFSIEVNGSEIAYFHYINKLNDNKNFRNYLIGITKENRIQLLKDNYSIVYESPFLVGRAISMRDNLLIVSSENVNCPPDKVILYKWIGNSFIKVAEKDLSSACISALGLYEIEKNYIQYIFANFEFSNKNSDIYFGFLEYINEDN